MRPSKMFNKVTLFGEHTCLERLNENFFAFGLKCRSGEISKLDKEWNEQGVDTC